MIRRLVELIQAHREWRLIGIEGHASDAGQEDYDMQLSRRRAELIHRILSDQGVDPTCLRAVAYGNEQPDARGSAEMMHALDRRVTFTVVQRADQGCSGSVARMPGGGFEPPMLDVQRAILSRLRMPVPPARLVVIFGES